MAFIRATGHSVPLMMQIAEGRHARVYASVLHARFGFHPTLIYTEEEVFFKSGKVDTILQPTDMFSVQSFLLHSIKLESLNNLKTLLKRCYSQRFTPNSRCTHPC
jgi:hypothetical protein